MKTIGIYIFIYAVFLTACSTSGSLTSEERELQEAADYAVANILFENELGGNASYNVHKDGAVVIKFDASVSFIDFNRVVNSLRTHPAITSVRAEQSGREVCPLK